MLSQRVQNIVTLIEAKTPEGWGSEKKTGGRGKVAELKKGYKQLYSRKSTTRQFAKASLATGAVSALALGGALAAKKFGPGVGKAISGLGSKIAKSGAVRSAVKKTAGAKARFGIGRATGQMGFKQAAGTATERAGQVVGGVERGAVKQFKKARSAAGSAFESPYKGATQDIAARTQALQRTTRRFTRQAASPRGSITPVPRTYSPIGGYSTLQRARIRRYAAYA